MQIVVKDKRFLPLYQVLADLESNRIRFVRIMELDRYGLTPGENDEYTQTLANIKGVRSAIRQCEG